MENRLLIIDDDIDILNIYRACLKDFGFTIETAGNGYEGLEKFKSFNPDLIILDIMMPKMGGYDFCVALRKQEGEIAVPIIFASAEQENDKHNAFSYGVVDYLIKPFRKTDLFNSINKNIGTRPRWNAFLQSAAGVKLSSNDGKFREFLEFFAGKSNFGPEEKSQILSASPSEIYALIKRLNLQPDFLAQSLAEFYKMQYLPIVDPDSIILGFLPVSFLQNNKIAAIMDLSGNSYFVLAEPFNEGLISLLKSAAGFNLAVTEPENIGLLFDNERYKPGVSEGEFSIENPPSEKADSDKWESAGKVKLSNILLAKALSRKENSILIEQKAPAASIRLGSQRSLQVTAKTAAAIILRYKLISRLDVIENQKSQNGVFKLDYYGKKYKIQVTTFPSPTGEICDLRISEVI